MITATTREAPPAGLGFERVFSARGQDPFESVSWAHRSAVIRDESGREIFRQDRAEVPSGYSDISTNVVVSKYFYGDPGKSLADGRPERETSVRQLVHRVARTIADWGHEDGIFADQGSADTFYDELVVLCLQQYAAFNSPVWFNVGLHHQYGIEGNSRAWRWDAAQDAVARVEPGDAYRYPQGSACFIQSVADNMEGIMGLATAEAMLFKYGSGTGTDLSTLRSSREKVSGGGMASGPVSFMVIYDGVASTVKSGGKTRRAAKMQSLKCTHPDILEFIEAKAKEERKAQALIAAGYDPDFNGEAYASVRYQNCNMSVRVTDTFLQAVETRAQWQTTPVLPGTPAGTMPVYQADQLMDKIAEGTWVCGDPGLQYETTIQKWHTCPADGPINASNPCCFVGETLIDTAEGKIRIDRLERDCYEGRPLPQTFAFDRATGLPVLRQINRAWKAGETTKLAIVTTDKGLSFICTREHEFLTYNGDYVAAKDLEPGTRLRKIQRSIDATSGSRKKIILPAGPETQARWMYEQIHGSQDENQLVHHENDDPSDDRLSNFKLVPRSRHQSLHTTGSRNGRYIECSDAEILRVWEEVEKIPRKNYIDGPSVTIRRWNTYIKANSLAGKVPHVQGGGRIRGMSWVEFTTWIEAQKSAVNDKVITVELIDAPAPVPVYDLEVDGTHNFSVTTDGSTHAIVVHNSEYMFLDNTSCNLASLNLLKFRRGDGSFDVNRYRAACKLMITAQEILVDHGSYPTEKIAANSHRFRPLGLGYCNLGALIMAMGHPYDSAKGRETCAALTAILTGQGYLTSAELAQSVGPFEGFVANQEPMLRVMEMHRAAVDDINVTAVDPALLTAARTVWDAALAAGRAHGYRNSQISVIAPTGTIAFMMGADTTGIEPEIGLVKYKNLAGGGQLKIINGTVATALQARGYADDRITAIVAHMEATGTIEGAPHLLMVDLPVFDCAFVPAGGKRSISFKGHVQMMAAAQPFVSGAISKTCNLPADATAAQIKDAYLLGWKLGLKALAIYRDGSKGSQVVVMKPETAQAQTAAVVHATPYRRRLPDTRNSVTHKYEIDGTYEGYLTVGLYDDGTPGEVFVTMAKEGSTVGGLMDTVGTLVSMGLQYGVPLEVFVDKFTHSRFDPSGFTKNPDIPLARSVIDYIFQWLGVRFIPGYRERNVPVRHAPDDHFEVLPPAEPAANGVAVTAAPRLATARLTGPPCRVCGAVMIPSGARCFRCDNCGNPGPCG
jgi:ribonucleotide reductase alpha subunit